MKNLILINLIIFTMFMSAGCSDVEDIDKLYLPTIMTFDEDNKSDKYDVNVVAMSFKSGKILYDFSKLNEKTISESIEHTQNTMSGKESMSLLQTIVLGEEFSKNSTYNLINWVYKQDINTNISMCVYKGDCSELVDSLNSKEEQSSDENKSDEAKSKSSGSKKETGDKIEYAINLVSQKKTEGYEITQKMNEFVLDNENSEKTAMLPTVKMNDENIEIVGTTVFKNYKNIGFIDLKNTKHLMLVRGVEGCGSTEFKNKSDGAVKGSNKRKVKVEKSKGKYIFNVEIDLDCNVVENNNGSLNLISDKRNVKDIEEYINKKLEAECNDFVNKVKNDIKYDVFDLTKYAKVKYSESSEDLKDEKFFENSQINIKVKSKINNNSLFN